jgi:hypothetical protein
MFLKRHTSNKKKIFNKLKKKKKKRERERAKMNPPRHVWSIVIEQQPINIIKNNNNGREY